MLDPGASLRLRSPPVTGQTIRTSTSRRGLGGVDPLGHAVGVRCCRQGDRPSGAEHWEYVWAATAIG